MEMYTKREDSIEERQARADSHDKPWKQERHDIPKELLEADMWCPCGKIKDPNIPFIMKTGLNAQSGRWYKETYWFCPECNGEITHVHDRRMTIEEFNAEKDANPILQTWPQKSIDKLPTYEELEKELKVEWTKPLS